MRSRRTRARRWCRFSAATGRRRAARLRKLALYAHGQERVTVEDVMAVVADASALALDNVIDAAFAGKLADVETQFAKARGAGTAPGSDRVGRAAPALRNCTGCGSRWRAARR